MGSYQRRGFASALLVAGLLSAAQAFAAALVSELQGDVRVGATQEQSRPAAAGERLAPGSTVSTGAGSRAILSFDDGQVAALHENTQFRIDGFRYQLEKPQADRAVFVLLQGALRVITGALGQRNPAAFELRTGETTIGIRGTDFMVAKVNPTYLSVLQGTISAKNGGGTALFVAGSYGAVHDRSTLAAIVRENELPRAASSAFGGLGALPVGPAAAPPGAAGKPKLPDRAVSQPQDRGAFGRETAERARGLKEDIERKMKKQEADAARERARDNGAASHPGSRRP